ncbi:hypothetical protein [Rhizobium rhizogenes]|uniref:hypothetical protein n=1 Tax=Rhizobium rhizogenes TaxID=359 RepID=UPI0015728C1F|nr:hypothetical protein [Rhizobium rhizogenes]NTF67983.1 hypothetical protein [Rhizobium rhizogenes]
MHRHIVFPGQIPLDTDLLNAIQDAYYGSGWLAQSMIGTGTTVVGLAVTPTVPASLQVNVAPGAIYSQQTVDSSAYGSLGTDANQIVKQGLAKTFQTLTITAPTTTGQSQNYLVQVAFSEADAAALTLPYYNASDPSVAWSGPGNSGTPQNTVRQDICVVGLKAGVPAPTGSQTTPSPDAGYTGIYVITVANGQTTITSGNITLLSTAPYFPTLPQVPASVQLSKWSYVVAGGSANGLTVTLNPPLASYAAGMNIDILIALTNTGAATLNVNGLGNVPLVNNTTGSALQGGELIGGRIATVKYDGTSARLMNSGLITPTLGQNLLINPAFQIYQRPTVSGSLSAGQYGHDRWKGGASGCTYSISPSQVATITAGSLIQVVEDFFLFLQQSVAQSGVYTPAAQPMTLSWAGTAQARINGGSYASSPLTFNYSAGNITIEFGIGTFQFPVLAFGQTPGAYVARPFGQELLLCMRYLERYGSIASARAADASNVDFSVTYAVPKRAGPSLSLPATGSLLFATALGSPTYAPATTTIVASNVHLNGALIRVGGWTGLTPGAQGFTYNISGSGGPPAFVFDCDF